MSIGESLPGEPEIYAAVFRFKRSEAERSRKTREYRTAARIKDQAHDVSSYPGSRRYTQRFSVLSEAVTENARILNGGGEEERTSKSNIKTWGGKTTKGREYRAEFSVLAERSRKTRAIGPDWVVIGWL